MKQQGTFRYQQIIKDKFNQQFSATMQARQNPSLIGNIIASLMAVLVFIGGLMISVMLLPIALLSSLIFTFYIRHLLKKQVKQSPNRESYIYEHKLDL